MKRNTFFAAALLLLALFLVAGTAPVSARAFPDVIPLPDGFRPEGIVIGHGHTAYAGSLADGDIYEVDLRTGVGEIVVQGPGTPAVGLAFDNRTGYLYVAGGPAGGARVYDTTTGALVESYAFGGAFVNDVTVTRDAAYFTDSGLAVFYAVELDPTGAPTGSLTTVPLSGDFLLQGPFSANGIVATPNGDGLIIVHSSLGVLYFVDPDTGDATEIDLDGQSVAAGDGLLLIGHRLYVVRNQLNQIVEFKMSGDYLSGQLVEVITDPDFDVPTTVDNHGASLYAVNARFGVANPSTAEYDIVKVKR